RLYIDTQVRMHKDVLESLDNRVIPAISNGEIKSTVTQMRRQISDHLTKAEGIQKKLDPSLAKAREEGGEKAGTTTTTAGAIESDAAKAKAKAKAKTDEAKKDTKDA